MRWELETSKILCIRNSIRRAWNCENAIHGELETVEIQRIAVSELRKFSTYSENVSPLASIFKYINLHSFKFSNKY